MEARGNPNMGGGSTSALLHLCLSSSARSLHLCVSGGTSSGGRGVWGGGLGRGSEWTPFPPPQLPLSSTFSLTLLFR